jgi:hypothetical protein
MQFQKLYESVMINESSLSRLLTHNNDHDCGVISASRKERVGKDNSERRKSLKRDILSHDYDVTDVMGKYEETVNDKKIVVSEDSMFVVDNGDVGGLEETLKELGIPGNKYLDGMSRGSGKGSYNYVLWDQDVLDKVALLERNSQKLAAMAAEKVN